MLELPDSPRKKVFRAIVDVLRTNPAIERVIRKGAFRAWEGTPTDAQPFSIEHAPAIRLTPATNADSFATPDSMKGALLINCEILLKGSNVDDLFDLWWAICKALYPADRDERSRLATRLQNAGARSGLAEFSQPAFDPQPDGALLAGQGQIRIEIQSLFN